MRPGARLVAGVFATAALFALTQGTVAKDTPGAEAEASSDVEGRVDFYRHVDSDRDGFVERDEVVNSINRMQVLKRMLRTKDRHQLADDLLRGVSEAARPLEEAPTGSPGDETQRPGTHSSSDASADADPSAASGAAGSAVGGGAPGRHGPPRAHNRNDDDDDDDDDDDVSGFGAAPAVSPPTSFSNGTPSLAPMRLMNAVILTKSLPAMQWATAKRSSSSAEKGCPQTPPSGTSAALRNPRPIAMAGWATGSSNAGV